MVKKHIKKHFWKYFLLSLTILVLGIISYNYYYYQKSKTLALDVYKNIDLILKDLDTTFGNFQTETDQAKFLAGITKDAERSKNLIRNNNNIINNFFVKLSRINGVLFPSEVGDILLWHSNFHDKLVTCQESLTYLFNQGLSLSIFNQENTTKEALTKLKAALYSINELLNDSSLDQKVADREELKKNIRNFNNLIDTFNSIFGNQKVSKYLVIFQNPYNLSATGGEWVLYGILNCKNSLCSLENVDLVSNLNIAMMDKLIPPAELKFANTVWVFQNFNWYYNFKTTAQIALKYYPEINNLSGLITVNSNDISELKTKKDVDLFISELNTKLNTNQFVSWLFSGLNNKDIQIYSTNSSIESFLNEIGWSGSFPKLDTKKNMDYLGLARANTGREDTDKDIKETVKLKVNIDEEGKITNSLQFILENNNSSKIKTKNFSYLRTYIPAHSELVKVESASIRGYAPKPPINYTTQGFIEEANTESTNMKTVYIEKQDVKWFSEDNFNGVGSWIVTSSGNKKTFSLTYLLPFKVDLEKNRHYDIFLEKQSGTKRIYNVEVSYPDPKDPTKTNSITRSLDLNQDTILSFDLN